MAITLPPDTVIQGVQIGWIWSPLVFDNEIWAVGLEPEDVSTEQQSSAVVDKTGKETANVVRRIHFSALVNKVESSVATKTHASRDHHMLCKLLTLSDKTGWLDVSFLAARPDCCSGCLQEGLDKTKNFLSVKKTRFVSRTLSRQSRILNDFYAQVVVQSFWARWNR